MLFCLLTSFIRLEVGSPQAPGADKPASTQKRYVNAQQTPPGVEPLLLLLWEVWSHNLQLSHSKGDAMSPIHELYHLSSPSKHIPSRPTKQLDTAPSVTMEGRKPAWLLMGMEVRALCQPLTTRTSLLGCSYCSLTLVSSTESKFSYSPRDKEEHNKRMWYLARVTAACPGDHTGRACSWM